ncbi:hypothetical protein [Polyangium mundeleinium]|uniref:Type VI secretion system effector TseH-like domain-containing protein n=1 Tax=Polyangium mundeleinium TaxID=2995306 RepID=A0ABT5EHN5_9BACT|nr:hypothetical protein [Polyangium mundeleinium]MDC0740688.1 hypothetical protein [Polyangium mundeleinium]
MDRKHSNASEVACNIDKKFPNDKDGKVVCESEDSVIPMVFPDFLITVEKKDFSWKERAGIKVTPGVSIASETDKEVKISGLGHAGVLIINGKTGETRYFEYGRYDAARIGLVREHSVSDVKVESDGTPTSSLWTYPEGGSTGTGVDGSLSASCRWGEHVRSRRRSGWRRLRCRGRRGTGSTRS